MSDLIPLGVLEFWNSTSLLGLGNAGEGDDDDDDDDPVCPPWDHIPGSVGLGAPAD